MAMREGTIRPVEDLWQVRIHTAHDAAYEDVVFTDTAFPYWTISYIVDGDIESTDAGIMRRAGSGQVMIHAPAILCGERSRRPGHHKWLWIEATDSFGFDLFRVYPINEIVTIADPEGVNRLLDQIIALWHEPDAPYRELLLSGLGLQLTAKLLQSWQLEGQQARAVLPGKFDDRLDKVLLYMRSSFSHKVTREEMARLVHISPGYLDELFEARYKLKPVQMLREIRMREVQRLLESSDRSLAEIAEQCGMGDAAYLSKAFVRRFGMTPGTYRKDKRRSKGAYYLESGR